MTVISPEQTDSSNTAAQVAPSKNIAIVKEALVSARMIADLIMDVVITEMMEVTTMAIKQIKIKNCCMVSPPYIQPWDRNKSKRKGKASPITKVIAVNEIEAILILFLDSVISAQHSCGVPKKTFLNNRKK